MSASYKLDVRIIKNIVRNNTLMVNDNEKLDFVVYYKSPRTKQLIMKNNSVIKDKLNNTNVIYKFNCPNEDCMLLSVNYVGSPSTTLSRRLTMHLANGAIKGHMLEKHNSNIGREHLVNHTEILHKHNDTFRMLIYEALHIKFHNPDLNRQDTGSTRILLLFA